MKINYTFNNGENSEVEVNEEIGAVILESRRKEENMERNRRRRCYSLDDVDFEGEDLADDRTPESLLIEQIDNEVLNRTIIAITDPAQVDEVIACINSMHKDGIRYYRVGALLDTKSDATNFVNALKKYRAFLEQQ